MSNVPNHLAIILDGNGRWAKRRGLPRNLGHYQGALNLFKIADECVALGVKVLTVYAFSTENWKRPKEEVDYLMQKPLEMLNKNEVKLNDVKYKVVFVGRKGVIPNTMQEVVQRVENATKNNTEMILQVALDYGSKEELIQAFEKMDKPFREDDLKKHLYVKQDVDLLIRTSGEQRLSNFLLWQASYAEFYFVKKHWPSFKVRHLKKAIKSYNKRHRRYGAL